MAKKRAAKAGKTPTSAGARKRVGSLRPKAVQSVRGGRIFTKHPAKVTVPDIKF